MTGRNGKDGGLVLVLDLNEDRSLSLGSLSASEDEEDFTLHLDKRDQDAKNNAKIHLRLLTPFAGVGGGSYQLTSVKNVKGTDAFLDMEESERQCVHERTEECQNRKMYEKCKCVPQEFQSIQVVSLFLFAKSLPFLLGGTAVFCRGEGVH